MVGAAGAGKSILFQALFTQLYDHFHDRKRRLQVFPRPIPLVPDYLRGVSPLRLPDLINHFIHTEVAAPVRQRTFEWMLTNGLIMWLFDGLDELYAGDGDFFHQLLEYLTEPDSQAQILICARHSLLKTSKTLTDFLNEFRPGPQEAIRVYQLNDWEHASKRTYAWISLEGRVPLTGEEDPPQVLQFLTTTRSPLLRQLSGLPYYCSLLIDEFKCGTLPQFSDEFSLIQYVISEMIRREKEKGVLRQEQFAHEGLNDWLETVAYEFYDERFTGVSKTEVEDYAELVLREELSENERLNVITTLIQFPLFAPGAQSGVITFKHELIAEYLAAEYFLKRLSNDPVWAARSLGTRTDLADSFLLRYMASRVAGRPGGLQVVINALRTEALPGRAFANLLQLLLLATPARDVIKANRIVLEGRDLGYVEFKGTDLREISFRNCDLSSATFSACDLHNTSFEGANLSGTRFDHLSDGALTGARFGRLERFEVIYVGTQRMDELPKAIEWAQKASGRIEKSQKPCPAGLQLRQLFLKFIYPGGEPRRHELLESALISGKRFEGAPSPEGCVAACLRFGYLEGPDWRRRIKRVPGDRYNDMVLFVRDWKLTVEMRQLLSLLCPMPGCEHVPELR